MDDGSGVLITCQAIIGWNISISLGESKRVSSSMEVNGQLALKDVMFNDDDGTSWVMLGWIWLSCVLKDACDRRRQIGLGFWYGLVRLILV